MLSRVPRQCASPANNPDSPRSTANVVVAQTVAWAKQGARRAATDGGPIVRRFEHRTGRGADHLGQMRGRGNRAADPPPRSGDVAPDLRRRIPVLARAAALPPVCLTPARCQPCLRPFGLKTTGRSIDRASPRRITAFTVAASPGPAPSAGWARRRPGGAGRRRMMDDG